MSSTPRKFSEKIAIMERKQNEDSSNFEEIMRQVRSITSNDPVPVPGGMAIPGGQLQPPQAWPHLSGSLPNVAQLHNYAAGPPGWPQNPWEQQRAGGQHRSRSPEGHFHPYRTTNRSPDRMPPMHSPYHHPPYHPHPHNMLQLPENWHQINRARSDPNIHHPGPMHGYQMPTGPPLHQMQPGPSGMNPMCQPSPMQQQQQQQQQMAMNQSPMQSPVQHMPGPYQFNNGSPMQSPMGSPMGSTMMLDDRTTPMMELSPPGMMDPTEASSLPNLPNLPQMPPSCYHATVGQRHSTGQCGRLVPGPPLTPESQSAPTSPANAIDPLAAPQWPANRTFSNSPESMDIPRLVLTNPDGAHGQHLDCFNDLQHLTLDSTDMNVLVNGSTMRQEPQIM